MSIRVKHIVALQISRDTDGDQKLFYPEVSAETVITDGFERMTSTVIAIAAAGTEALNLGDVTTVRGIYIEVDRDCNLRINGSSDDIPLKIPPSVTAGGSRAKVFLEATITAVTIENLDVSNALSGVCVVWGDPTP